MAGAIPVDIVLNINGQGEVNAKLKITQQELDRLGMAGQRAGAGIKAVEDRNLTLNQGLSKTTEALGKVTFAASALGTLLGGAFGGALGAAVTAIGSLGDAMGITAARTRSLAAEGRALTEDQVKLAAGVTNLAAAYDLYARKLGTTAEKLTLVQEMEARRQLVNGQIQTQESIRGRLGPAIERRDEAARAAEGARARIARRGASPADNAILAALEREQANVDNLERAEANTLGVGPWQKRSVAAVAAVKSYLLGQYGEIVGFVGKVEGLLDRQLALKAGRDAERAARGAGPKEGAGGLDPRDDFATIGRVLGESLGPYLEKATSLRSARVAEEEWLAGNAGRRQAGLGGRFKGFVDGSRGMARGKALVDAENRSYGDNFAQQGNQAFSGLADEAMGSAAIIANATGQITQSMGQMWTNLVLSGGDGVKGFRRFIGEQLAGISAQAFGYATLLGGMALAAAATGPIFGWNAPGLAAGAAVMAGTGIALAVGARALGASASGGFKGSGGGGGGGGTRLGSGNNVRNQVGQGGPSNVTVIVGISRGQVHDAVVDESRGRQSSRRPAVMVAG